MHPQIIFEDSDLLIINKPAGITVNRSDTTSREETVQDWAEAHLQVPQVARVPQVSQEETNEARGGTRGTFDTRDIFIERGGIVHRLDKETSGILIIAKNPQSFENLQSQFKNRTVKKTYLALVHGKVEPDKGEINVPVGRLPWNRKRFGVMPGGRESKTKYKVLSVVGQSVRTDKPKTEQHETENRKQRTDNRDVEYLSLLELYPETGRTHQIRVHLKHINHPIFSDELYAGRKTARNDRKLLNRVFLHASKISFNHPAKGESFSFEAPLSEELENLLTKISTSSS